jgi:hypothetical protein
VNQKSRLFFIFGITSLIAFLLVLILFPNQPVTTKDIYQYIDYDAQIVCYILENGNGISCLPLSEVNISE